MIIIIENRLDELSPIFGQGCLSAAEATGILYMYAFVVIQHLRTSRMWRKVNFLNGH